MLRVLAQGVSGSGCTVPCEIYKRSKCLENIPHIENVSMCHIEKIFSSGAAVWCCVIFLNGPNAWKLKYLPWNLPTALMKYSSFNL